MNKTARRILLHLRKRYSTPRRTIDISKVAEEIGLPLPLVEKAAEELFTLEYATKQYRHPKGEVIWRLCIITAGVNKADELAAKWKRVGLATVKWALVTLASGAAGYYINECLQDDDQSSQSQSTNIPPGT